MAAFHRMKRVRHTQITRAVSSYFLFLSFFTIFLLLFIFLRLTELALHTQADGSIYPTINHCLLPLASLNYPLLCSPLFPLIPPPLFSLPPSPLSSPYFNHLTTSPSSLLLHLSTTSINLRSISAIYLFITESFSLPSSTPFSLRCNHLRLA